jgi:hypothetical protein
MKQYNVKRVGGFIHVLYLTMPLFGLAGYTASFITMYTVLLPYIKPIMPWLTAPLFFGVGLAVCGIAVFCFYTFVYPSYMAFQNRQEYSHNSLLRKDLEAIKKQLGIKIEEIHKN